jgi:hypothetical protein
MRYLHKGASNRVRDKRKTGDSKLFQIAFKKTKFLVKRDQSDPELSDSSA